MVLSGERVVLSGVLGGAGALSHLTFDDFYVQPVLLFPANLNGVM